jgi:hypothetical protein
MNQLLQSEKRHRNPGSEANNKASSLPRLIAYKAYRFGAAVVTLRQKFVSSRANESANRWDLEAIGELHSEAISARVLAKPFNRAPVPPAIQSGRA